MKECFRCKQSKPLSDFNKRTSAKDGLASWCRQCQHSYHKGWKKANPQKVQENGHRYYVAHTATINAYGAKWRSENKERHREMIARWEAEHPDRVAAKYKRYIENHRDKVKQWQDERRDSGRRRISNMVRRALEAKATIPGSELTPALLWGRFSLHGWRCYYCGKELTPRTVEADHRIPLSRGGLNCGANIVPSCRTCNTQKSDKTEREYRAWKAVYLSASMARTVSA